jgi:tRNA modification GTPase
VIAVLNKSDLRRKIDEEYIKCKSTQTVYISAKTGDGIEKLEELTSGLLENGTLDTDSGIIANERQLACVKSAKDGVAAALHAQRDGITLDAVSTGIEQAVSQLSALTGERATEEIIERVFEKFCVGK